MPGVTWTQTADGYDGGDYRLRREPGRGGWRIEVARRISVSDSRWVVRSSHATRREAMAVVEELVRVRAKRARVLGHLAVGAVAAAACAVLVDAMSSIATFVLAVIALFIALRSFAAAVAILLADAWGWSRDDGSVRGPGLLERLSVRVADRHARQVAEDAAGDPDAGVRVLPPSPGRLPRSVPDRFGAARRQRREGGDR